MQLYCSVNSVFGFSFMLENFVFVKNEKLAEWLSFERAIDHSRDIQNLNQSKNERKRKYKKNSRGKIK